MQREADCLLIGTIASTCKRKSSRPQLFAQTSSIDRNGSDGRQPSTFLRGKKLPSPKESERLVERSSLRHRYKTLAPITALRYDLRRAEGRPTVRVKG